MSKPDANDANAHVTTGDANWTIFVYGHADHNLSVTFIADLAEMSAAKLDPSVQLIVLTDLDASQSFNGQQFASGWTLYRVAGHNQDLIELDSGPEANLDDPAVLSSMTERVFKQFPASKRGVILWDHGGTWSGGFGGDSQNGTLEGNEMRGLGVLEIMSSVATGLAGAGVSGERPLDLLSFDTCLMAGAEVMSEASKLAKVYVANAELDFGRGWDYTKTLTWLSENPEASVQQFAAAEVQFWDAHHAPASLSDALFRAHGAFDLQHWDALMTATSELADVATRDVDPAGLQGYFSMPTYNAGLESAGRAVNLRDIGMFSERLSRESQAIADAAINVTERLDQLTLGLSLGTVRQRLAQTGVHVELTTGKAFDPVKPAYEQLAPTWGAGAHWVNLLQAMADADDGLEPTIVRTVTGAGQINFSVAQRDVADAEITLGFRTRDGLIPIAPIAHQPISAGVTYSATWNGLIYITTAGGSPQPLSVLPWLSIVGDDPQYIYSTPARADTGDDVLFLFTEESETAEVAIVLGTSPAVLTTSEMRQIVPGLKIAPVYRAMSADHEKDIVGDYIELPAEGLPIKVARPPVQQFVIVTSVSDYWGNTSVVEDKVSCPGW